MEICNPITNGHFIVPMADPIEKDSPLHAFQSHLNADEVGHINAHGLSGPLEDEAEARAIYRVFGPEAKRVPVTANKSYFGNLGAGTGAVELIASVLALEQGVIPPTLNYEQGDPECRLNVVAGDPMESQAKSFVSTSFTTAGQSAALAVRAFAA